jgi:predicted O-linked N-acetylglucosamine transferase (SPINDLY family)
VASMIREDQIDILVELTGHTAGNRLDVVAMRPAPIQITYFTFSLYITHKPSMILSSLVECLSE